jgi:hypothetical protein
MSARPGALLAHPPTIYSSDSCARAAAINIVTSRRNPTSSVTHIRLLSCVYCSVVGARAEA